MRKIKLQSIKKYKRLSNLWIIAVAPILIICSCLISSNVCLAQSSDPLVSVLPLKDMSAFRNVPGNWHVAGDIYYPFNKEKTAVEEKGHGVLINNSSHNDNDALVTSFEHGDMDLEFDFMLPNGSNSAVYLQGKYGIRLNDSWNDTGSLSNASGAIYMPGNNKVVPPRMNVCKAPGLWQNLKISYKAPRFDKDGKKISNARFHKVVYNGVVIHENIEVPGITLQSLSGEEKILGPLMFSGNGEIAIRNIRYKKYGDEKVKLNHIMWSAYTDTSIIPDHARPSKSGHMSELTWEPAGNPRRLALKFDGEISIPRSGTYVFEIQTWYISKLVIDDQTVIANGDDAGSVKLEKGSHKFSLLCTKEDPRGKPLLGLFVEGPGIARQPLHSPSSLITGPADRPIILEPGKRTIVQRCFLADGEKKRTFCVAVGAPERIHYAMDLSQGTVINLWKGEFLDVTTMWTSRGEEQLAKPLGSVLELSTKPVFAILQNENAAWPDSMEVQKNYQFKGYQLDEQMRPTFQYLFNGAAITDRITATDNSRYFTRTLSVKGENSRKNLWFRLAEGSKIENLGKGLYAVNDKTYYIRINAVHGLKPVIRKIKNGEELLIPAAFNHNQAQLEYSIIW